MTSRILWSIDFKVLGWDVHIVPNMVRHGYRIWKARREGHYPGGYWDFQRCFYDPRKDAFFYGLSCGPLSVSKPADASHAHLCKPSRFAKKTATST